MVEQAMTSSDRSLIQSESFDEFRSMTPVDPEVDLDLGLSDHELYNAISVKTLEENDDKKKRCCTIL